jgi:hypothetical protein
MAEYKMAVSDELEILVRTMRKVSFIEDNRFERTNSQMNQQSLTRLGW